MRVPTKWLLILAVFAWYGSECIQADDGVQSERKVLVSVRLLDEEASDDNKGSKVLASPKVMAVENKSFEVGVGQTLGIPDSSEKVYVGWKLKGKTGKIIDGKIQLDFKLSMSQGGTRLNQDSDLRIENRSMRMITTIPLKKTKRYRYSYPNYWIELTVEEVPE